MKILRNFVFLLVFLCFSPMPLGAWAQSPDALARSVTDEVLGAIRADKDLQSGNSKKLLDLVETKVLPHFNFQGMTQLAMGRNWRSATPEQQKQLVNEFRILLVRTYTTAFTSYKNQTVEYKPVRMRPDDTEVTVQSLIKQPSGPPVGVDYTMEKAGGVWKVYNIKVEGVSLVENYRNTFNTEIQKTGVDGLIKALAEKNRSAQVAQK